MPPPTPLTGRTDFRRETLELLGDVTLRSLSLWPRYRLAPGAATRPGRADRTRRPPRPDGDAQVPRRPSRFEASRRRDAATPPDDFPGSGAPGGSFSGGEVGRPADGPPPPPVASRRLARRGALSGRALRRRRYGPGDPDETKERDPDEPSRPGSPRRGGETRRGTSTLPLAAHLTRPFPDCRHGLPESRKWVRDTHARRPCAPPPSFAPGRPPRRPASVPSQGGVGRGGGGPGPLPQAASGRTPDGPWVRTRCPKGVKRSGPSSVVIESKGLKNPCSWEGGVARVGVECSRRPRFFLLH